MSIRGSGAGTRRARNMRLRNLFMSDLFKPFLHAVRVLSKNPGFTLSALVDIDARHRSEYRDLQRGERCPVEAASVFRLGCDRHCVSGTATGGIPRPEALLRISRQLPGLAQAERCFRIHVRLRRPCDATGWGQPAPVTLADHFRRGLLHGASSEARSSAGSSLKPSASPAMTL